MKHFVAVTIASIVIGASAIIGGFFSIIGSVVGGVGAALVLLGLRQWRRRRRERQEQERREIKQEAQEAETRHAMDQVKRLQQTIYQTYAGEVGLDPSAHYIHGTPLRPVVPLDTNSGGLFIVGAYPSARFALVNGVSDVPVADNLGPFESERWFDGSRVREQPSAREFKTYFLEPLGLDRSVCWITDLVKVFLFKPGHVKRYQKIGALVPVGYERGRLLDLGKRSIPTLERELRVARPRLMITLGEEVAGVLRGKRPSRKLLVPEISELAVGDEVVRTMHCAHPGILMRGSSTDWPKRHREEFLPALKRAIGDVDS